MKTETTELERLVVEIQQAGQDWVEAKLKSEQLEEDQKPFLAALMNDLGQGPGEDFSEAKLDRLARGSKYYRDFIRGMCLARTETNRKKIRYESLLNLFEAKRSGLALERVKIEKGIFSEGRG